MFQKVSVSKNIRLERGTSRLSIEKLLSHRTETFRREPNSVPLTSSIEQIFIRRRVMSKFPIKKRLTVPNHSVEESFCVVEI